MYIISVVVPVYNVEKYLSTCLDSLLNQGLEESEYEIILVNDGTTDNSLEICNHYAEKHSNIRVLSQENQGVSAARNFGLGKANGEWVMFVDSDDYISKNSLRFLLSNFCKEEYDAVRFWTRIRSDASIDREMSCDGKVYFVGSGFDFIERYGLETFCYTTLYRRSFLEAHSISFSHYRMGEDFLFASEVLLANPRLCSTSCKVYQYLIHPNSASTSRSGHHARACVYDHLAANDVILSILDNKSLKLSNPTVYKKCIESIQGKFSLIFSRILCSDIFPSEFKHIISKQKKLGVLPLRIGHYSIKARAAIFGINLLVSFPFLYLPARFLYSTFFVPFILPKLDRNK